MSARVLPPLATSMAPATVPHRYERLDNGLTVVVIRRPVVPLVEIRLCVELGPADPAQVAALASTLLPSGAERAPGERAALLRRVGAEMATGAERDRIVVRGTAPAETLREVLAMLSEALSTPQFTDEEVARQTARLADQAAVMAARPEHASLAALSRLVHGTHPYADQSPAPHRLRSVTPRQLRALRTRQVRPAAATLAVVGDVDPAHAVAAAQAAFRHWQDPAAQEVAPGPRKSVPAGASGLLALPVERMPPLPPLVAAPEAVVLVDRPGAAQSALRVALPAVGRSHPDYPALRLGNLVLGGYFSSRLVTNLREDKGYCYAPGSSVVEMRAGSLTVVAADPAAPATGATLREMWRELDRFTAAPVTSRELDQARQYAVGGTRLGMASNAGLADAAVRLDASGLSLDWVEDHVRRLADVTAADVLRVAQSCFGAARAASLVLGDADRVTNDLAVFASVRWMT